MKELWTIVFSMIAILVSAYNLGYTNGMNDVIALGNQSRQTLHYNWDTSK